MGNSDETFLKKIISNIPESFGEYGDTLMEYSFSGDEVKKLLTDSFKKGGNEGLIKELEKNNFFIVFQGDDLPSNYSLVSEYNKCVLVWKNEEIEDYTFFVMEYPDEFKIYLHKTSSSIRLYGEPISDSLTSLESKKDIEKVFEKIVTDYMIDIFWHEFDYALEDGGGQRFLSAMGEGEFSRDFDRGAFFNFDGIEIPQNIKDEAYQKILENVEEELAEERGEDQYEGELNDIGQRHGRGTITWSNGDKYEGDFKEGKEHGQGTITWSDGGKYVGEFKDGKRDGQGTETWSNGYKYEGDFKEGKEHGRGTITWSNGDKYEGEFKNGEEHGQGTKKWSNEDKYEGEFKNGEEHGQGTMTCLNGDKFEGEWQRGTLDGQCKCEFSDGSKYEGYMLSFKSNLREFSQFEGTMILPNGEKYEGEIHPQHYPIPYQGTLTLPDGSEHEGEWMKGERWNITETDKKGKVIGKWLNGVKQK